jgi:spore coat protein A
MGLASAIAAALALGGIAQADTVTLYPSSDNTLYESTDGSLSNGVGAAFIAGLTNQSADVNIRRALIQFNFAAIPAGSVITSATLQLNCSRTIVGAMPVSLHRCLASWGEGASNSDGADGAGADAQPGDATWIHRYFPNILWTTPGGDFDVNPSAITQVAQEGLYTWSSAGMVADIQNWVNGVNENSGWVITGDEHTTPSAKKFDSRECPVPANRPQLTITFTPPANSGACCLANNTCIVASPENCAAQGGSYGGNGSPCATAPCTQPTGACCVPGSGCMIMTMPDCVSQSGTYHGDGTACASGLCSAALTPFVDPLPIPAVAQPTIGVPGGAASYTINITQFQQQLHRDLPPTTLWGYNGTYPGPTIEASSDQTVQVRWINNLRDSGGQYLQHHYFGIDLCLHGPMQYGDSPRTVVHLHGAHVPASSDGFPDQAILPGQEHDFTYPNHQPAATLWYHDHALGITAPNVYMGLAGFYLLRDPAEQGLGLPSGEYEIPLVIQDRTFNPDGTLQYPPIWHEHVLGDTILVNGKVWPVLPVKQGKYRFRLLNGSNSRTYTLSLSSGGGFWQIGSDTGLLASPLYLTQLTMSPGERADCIIDFSAYARGTEIILTNSAPAPFPGPVGVGVVPNVMKFIVTSDQGFTAGLPGVLSTIIPMGEAQAAMHRSLIIKREASACTGEQYKINGLMFSDITEYPRQGDIEVWQFINRSNQTHPMHMHLVRFQVLNRQPFVIGNDGVTIIPTGSTQAPAANELGWKDTVRCPPSMITRVITSFEDYTGAYVYHCHMLEHEDNEMMRQFLVMPGCGTADFNCDGDTGTDADIESFFSCLAGNCPLPPCTSNADFNGDGDVGTDADIESFFRVLAGGPC